MSDDLSLVDKAFEPLIRAAEGNAPALLKLAVRSRMQANHDRAVTLAQAALRAEPDDPEIEVTARDIIARSIPRWHVPLVQDQPRNDAFQAALERNVKPGMRVLDVGAGTGLLAMMAARAGAGAVYSCELNPVMAQVAAEIVRSNGLDDRIKVLSKHSRAIDPDSDMGGLADLVVAEILGSDLVCEHVLPTLQDVHLRLARPGARYIPEAGEIRVALGWWSDLASQHMASISGFDLTAFNRLVRPSFRLPLGRADLHLRGTASTLFSFDFTKTEHGPDQTEIDLIADGGPVNGVVQWIRLKMDDVATLENRPEADSSSSWACYFHPLPEPVEPQSGDRIRIGATHQGNRLKIWHLPPPPTG